MRQVNDGLAVDHDCDDKAQFRTKVLGHHFISLSFRINGLYFLIDSCEPFGGLFRGAESSASTLQLIGFKLQIIQMDALLEDDFPMKVEIEPRAVVGNGELEINPFGDDRCAPLVLVSGVLSFPSVDLCSFR